MERKKQVRAYQTTLFPGIVEKSAPSALSPLADRMRPRKLKDFVGQEHLLGEGKFLLRLIKNNVTASLLFWGPPGSGKTTLAHLIAKEWNAYVISLSAVLIGLKEVRESVETAKSKWLYEKTRTILLIDEIHRFNKAQQDALLPHVEKGTITLFGITTENPSFAIIAPLLSRLRVVRLNPLSQGDLEKIIKRALEDEKRGFGKLRAEITEDAMKRIIKLADSDARMALNMLELAVLAAGEKAGEKIRVTEEVVNEVCQAKPLLYDKSGEEHFNLISALHKSLRGSDPDAGLYYLARMLLAGEDPLYIARRLVRFASEDVGLADPRALGIAVNAVRAFQMLGHPEGELALAEAVVYLATAPKSNAIYRAFDSAQAVAREKGALPVPMKLRNAPTKFMKKEGYGKGYKYPHDYENGFVDEDYLPEEIAGTKFYYPTERGEEKIIAQRMKKLRSRDNQK